MNNKNIVNYIYWFLTGAFIIIATVVILSVVVTPGGFRLSSVVSGSMEPSIKVGSVILTIPSDNYEVGDVISFESVSKSSTKYTTTHRIHEKIDGDDEQLFVTKGDLNEDIDAQLVSENEINGKLFISIPFLGYLVSFTRTKLGLLVMIIIPAFLLVLSEVFNISKEVKRQKEVKNAIK